MTDGKKQKVSTYPSLRDYHICICDDFNKCISEKGKSAAETMLLVKKEISNYLAEKNTVLHGSWILQGVTHFYIGAVLYEALVPFVDELLWREGVSGAGAVLVPYSTVDDTEIYPYWVQYTNEWDKETFQSIRNKNGEHSVEETIVLDAVWSDAVQCASGDAKNLFEVLPFFLEKLYEYDPNNEKRTLHVTNIPFCAFLYAYQWFRMGTAHIELKTNEGLFVLK